MLNGLEKSLEKHLSARSMADLPESERLWRAQGVSGCAVTWILSSFLLKNPSSFSPTDNQH